MSKIKCILIAVMSILVVFFWTKVDYTKPSWYSLQVISTFENSTGFVGVFKTEDSRIIDQPINASMFTQIKQGDTLLMKLNPYQYDEKNSLLFQIAELTALLIYCLFPCVAMLHIVLLFTSEGQRQTFPWL
ncbi:MAG: hypothetical protein [Caudoviricetes sp.]|nr:MAG: hypothetical protein [Caudoviricetes sp.]